ACASRAPVASEKKSSAPSLDAADTLFAAGAFRQAEQIYSRILSENPSERKALERRGSIALYSNRLSEAKAMLRCSVELDPSNPKLRGLLAESYYRSHEFQEAAALFRSVGREAMARKLESFKDKTPYHSIGEETVVKLVQTDPLPVVSARLNGGEPGLFIVDTGGSELIVDTEAAQRAGVKLFGAETTTYAGDLKGSYEHGALAELQLGHLTVQNVPVHVRDTRAFSAVAGGKRVDGILGTVFLYHFLTTLDYPQG